MSKTWAVVWFYQTNSNQMEMHTIINFMQIKCISKMLNDKEDNYIFIKGGMFKENAILMKHGGLNNKRI